MPPEPSPTRGSDVRFPTLGPTPPLTAGSQQTETALRAAVMAMIQTQGASLADRVVCIAGEPDLVTADRELIIELKWRLTKKALCAAIGQLLLYRQAINPEARAAIIGYPTPETLALLPLVAALGVEVVCWQDGANVPANRERTTASLSSPVPDATPHPDPTPPRPGDVQHHHFEPGRALRWNIAALAQAQGIANPSQLATRLGISRQGLYALWSGTADQVSLEILSRLAHILGANQGDWFRWGMRAGEQGLEVEGSGRNGAPHQADPILLNSAGYAPHDAPLQHPGPRPPTPPPLLWNVAAQAEARGIDVVDLGFRSAVYPRSLKPIWRGEAQAVAPATLARLALVLDLPGQPFSIGDLFVWAPITSGFSDQKG